MKQDLKQYMVKETLFSVVFNIALNATIGILLFHAAETIPLYGPRSIAGDTIATAFLLSFLVSLIVSPLTKRRMRKGHIPNWEQEATRYRVLRILPSGTLPGALVLAVLVTTVTIPIALATFNALSVTELTFIAFVAYKSTLAAILAAIVTPIATLRSMAAYKARG